MGPKPSPRTTILVARPSHSPAFTARFALSTHALGLVTLALTRHFHPHGRLALPTDPCSVAHGNTGVHIDLSFASRRAIARTGNSHGMHSAGSECPLQAPPPRLPTDLRRPRTTRRELRGGTGNPLLSPLLVSTCAAILRPPRASRFRARDGSGASTLVAGNGIAPGGVPPAAAQVCTTCGVCGCATSSTLSTLLCLPPATQ